MTPIVSMIMMAACLPLSMAATGVKGTFFTETASGGSCELPPGTYTTPYSLALGQGDALGNLKYRGAMCGKVLEVNCGGTTVDAVVVNACNENSNTCGVDLIGKAWNLATGDKPHGEVECTVSLTSKNPFSGGPKCFKRPNSDASNANFVIVGILNTGTDMVTGVTVGSAKGRPSGSSGWFEVNGSGFTPDTDVVFTLSSGTAAFKLSKCEGPAASAATF